MKLHQTFVYLLRSPDFRIYIGQTVDLKRRLSEYRRCQCAKQPKLQKAIQSFGFELFEVEVLFSGSVTKQELNALERAFIRKYDSENPLTGLNSTQTY
jgi:group I intron endonuclease